MLQTTSTGTPSGPAINPTQSAGPAVELLTGEVDTSRVAYTVSRVDISRARAVQVAGSPEFGDVVLAEVTAVGQHGRLENANGRRVPLAEGARVVVAYGTRYAPDQFEAVVPDDLGPCQLVAGGGIAAVVLSQHEMMKDATALSPVGLLVDGDGRRLNTADGLWEPASPAVGAPPLVLLVTGSSMNSGKTTTGAMACRGLAAAGYRVGAAKVTGSGAGNDVWSFYDNGARPVVDFTHAGYPSTWQVPHAQIVRIFGESLRQLAAAGCDVAVVEVADGVYQPETAQILQDPVVRRSCDGVLFAATDPLCATAGVAWLRAHDLEPLAITGLLSASPLGVREFRSAVDHPVWSSALLSDPAYAAQIVSMLRERRQVAG